MAFQVERFFLDGDRIHLDEVRARFETGRFIVAEDAGGIAGCVYIELRGERAYLGCCRSRPNGRGRDSERFSLPRPRISAARMAAVSSIF